MPEQDLAISFGPFRLLPSQRLLLDGARPVRLGARPLDLLIALASRPGELVDKRELMEIVWPKTTVVEANLAVNMNTVRQALGDGRGQAQYIATVPGHGYQFVAPVERTHAPVPAAIAPHGPHNLPSKLTRLVGRGEAVADLVRQLAEHRLITLVGPGGIGKTAVALEVAEDLISTYDHGVWLIDLARVADPARVSSAVASALRLEVTSNAPVSALAEALRDQRMLLVLDNCEHVIEAAATLALALLGGAAGVRILATSREPLRVAGEHVHRLASLPGPPPSVPVTSADALEFPAVQLFVERASASVNTFSLSDADATSAGDICRRLDGLPLAIEFAAARVDVFGVRGLAAQFEDRLPLGATGRRSADHRHRTLNNLLDWSYRLLGEHEKAVFRLLAVFAGPFTLEAANAVAGRDVTDEVLELTSKSLLAADTGEAEPRFRFLETTRAFALERLAEDADADTIRRSHALYCLDLLRRFSNPDPNADNNPTAISGEIDNVRAALHWAFSSLGERSLAVDLVAASAPLWTAMSLLAESCDWMSRGLAAIEAGASTSGQELIIRATLASSMILARGMTDEVYANWSGTAELASRLGQRELEAEAVMVMFAHQVRRPNLDAALSLCHRYDRLALALGTPAALALSSYMLGNTLDAMGMVAEAHTCLARSLAVDRPEDSQAFLARYGFCRRTDARHLVADLLYQSGLPDEALSLASEYLLEARATGYPIPLNGSLAGAGFLRLLIGRPDAEVEPLVKELRDNGERLKAWEPIGIALGLEGMIALRRGEAAAESLFEEALDGITKAAVGALHPYFVAGLATSLGIAGQADRGLAKIEDFEATWPNTRYLFSTEVLRVKAELLALKGPRAAREAEKSFLAAIGVARSEGALFWELRAVTSYARLLRTLGRSDEARTLLTSTLDQFRPGCECADLTEAKRALYEN